MEKISAKFNLMSGKELWDFLIAHSPYKKVYIATPYFSERGKDRLFEILPQRGKTDVKLIFRKDLISVLTDSMNTTAINDVLCRIHQYGSKCHLKWLPTLHAKIYLFEPGKICVVGSSNLTEGGLGDVNRELNVVWEKSSKTFDTLIDHFIKLWQHPLSEIIDEDILLEIENNLGISSLSKLKKNLELLKGSLFELPEFSRLDMQHQSYQFLKELNRFLKHGKTWESLIKKVKNMSKSDNNIAIERKLLFLVNNGLLHRSENEKIYMTKFGKDILKNNLEFVKWLNKVQPLTQRLLFKINDIPNQTYDELATLCGITHNPKMEIPIRWLTSVGFVSRRGRQWFITRKGKSLIKSWKLERAI